MPKLKIHQGSKVESLGIEFNFQKSALQARLRRLSLSQLTHAYSILEVTPPVYIGEVVSADLRFARMESAIIRDFFQLDAHLQNEYLRALTSLEEVKPHEPRT